MITISLCMIVKNEEKLLDRCLSGIAPLMDEIIIVDTGSTDRTKEIAHEFTDLVYDFVWTDDFSAARNFSFSKASKEYIYTADADEVIDLENLLLFSQLKKFLLPEIDIVQMLYCNQLEFGTTYNFDEEYRPKLYKRLRSFTWQHPIHESVILEPVIYDSDIRIQHMPLASHAGRDFHLFERITRKGLILPDKLHTMYAKELLIAGTDSDFLSAEKTFSADVSAESTSELCSPDRFREAGCILARIYRIKGDLPNFFRSCLKDVAVGSCSEICCELGNYYLEAQDASEAYLWYYNAAFETAPILSARHGKELPLEGLVTCCHSLGWEEKAGEYELAKKSESC